ncbi:MAG: tyrosine-type recombinase/integrase [Pseudomonadales bacterium]|nr:tyrosine-type recombinase/integrase [Pseudomonadales bacterium]
MSEEITSIDTLTLSPQNNSALSRPQSNPYIKAATSDNTRRTYRAAIKKFESWGGRLPTHPEVLTQYLLTSADKLSPRTLTVHLTALSQWHHYQSIDDPTQHPSVRKTLEGIRRVHSKPKRKAKALRLEHLATMLIYLNGLSESNKRSRDIALILIAFFGAFRRSELVAITVQDLTWEPEGLVIHILKSKTDQESQGIYRAIPKSSTGVCPVSSLKTWLDSAAIIDGPIFRAVNRWDQVQEKSLYPGSITDILRGVGDGCQFKFTPELSSHSFRRGLSTSAARENIDFELIKRQGGWKSDATVWEYIEEGGQLSGNVGHALIDKMNNLISND